MPNQVSFVWSTAQGVVAEIERWLKDKEGKTLFIRFKPADLLRLTRLQVWSYRHRVSVYDILSLVLPYLRKTIASHNTKRYGLGVSIAALTGAGAEKILIEAINQTYPEREHIAEWRENERQRQLDVEASEERGGLGTTRVSGPLCVLDADSPKEFIKSYSKRVIANRQRSRVAYGDPKRRELRHRGNPWL
jgi:hypothetical protein